jgi:uncharacterized membrane protein YheB (UPF0754 family)
MNNLSLTNRIGTDLLRFVDRKGLFSLFFILFDMVFQKIVEAIKASPLKMMLDLIGGESALGGIKPPVILKLKETFSEILQAPATLAAIEDVIRETVDADSIMQKVTKIVEQRLDELTPQMVKVIVQDMIKEHLDWLVVWGGVFGALIGLVASLMI